MKIYIYGLYEDKESELHYIGASKSPNERLEVHCNTINDPSPRGQWIKELRDKNKRPQLKILEETDETNARNREQCWIDKYLVKSPITNYPHSGYSTKKNERYNSSITIRVNNEWLNRLKEIASEKGMNYQSLLKSWVTEKMW